MQESDSHFNLMSGQKYAPESNRFRGHFYVFAHKDFAGYNAGNSQSQISFTEDSYILWLNLDALNAKKNLKPIPHPLTENALTA